MPGRLRPFTRRERRLMALGWLLLLHFLADLAVALYRCAAIHPLLTDLFAGALMRAQFGLLCVWLFAGKDPLSWRLAGFLSGSAGMFVVYSRLMFPGFHKPSLGPSWFRSDFDLYFRSTGPGDLLLKAPVMFVLIGVAMLIYRGAVWELKRYHPPRKLASRNLADESGARLHWLQFSFADYLIWSFTLGLLLMVFTVVPYHEGWLELVRWRWGLGLQGMLPDSRLMMGAAIPTAAMVLLGAALGQSTTGHHRRLAVAAVIGFLCGIGLEAWWQEYHRGPLLFSSPTGTQRISEVLVQPLVAMVVAGSCWLVAIYDAPNVPTAKPATFPAPATEH